MAIIQSLNLVFKAQTNKAAQSIKSLTGDIGKLGKKFGITGNIARAAATALSVQFFKSIANGIDEQAKFADRLGASFEALQNLQFAAGLAGVKVSALNVGMQRMTRRLGEVFVKGAGQAKDTIDRLGLSLEDLRNMRSDQQFLAIGSALGKVENQSEKLALTFSLFDTEGAALVNLFDQMADGGAEVSSRLSKLGGVLSRQDASQVEKMNDSFSGLGSIFSALGDIFVAKMASPIQKFTNDIITMLGETAFLDQMREAAIFTAGAFDLLGRALKIVGNLGTITLNILSGGMAALLLPITTIIEGLGKLGKTLGLISEDTAQSLEDFNRKTVFKNFQRSAKGLVTDVKDIGDAFRSDGIDSMNASADRLKNSVEGVKGTMEGMDDPEFLKKGKLQAKVTFAQEFDTSRIDVSALSQSGLKTEAQRQLTETKRQTSFLEQIAKNTASNQGLVLA